MLLQDFDPQVHTVNDFVQFCERLETMENEEKPPREKHTNNNNGKRKRSSSNSTRNNNSNSRGQKKSLDCMLHGNDCGYSTDQCFVLKKQAEKLNLLRGVVKNTTTEIYICSLNVRSERQISPESEVRKLVTIYKLSNS